MKRLLMAALVTATLAGCRKSELQTENQSKINLATSVANFDEHIPQKPAGTQSKAAEKAKNDPADFAVGQALGLFLHTTPTVGKAAECHSQNIEYATPDGGVTWNQRASLDGDIDPATTYYATAYSPYVEGQIDPLAMPFSVEKDQTELAKFEQSDLRLTPASPLQGAGATANVALDFTHALAMFELKLLIPANVEGKAVAKLETVTFENLATSTSINLATGSSTTDLQSVASITPRITSGTGEVAVMTTYRAHVPPQNVDGGVMLAKIRCKMVDGSTETMDYITPSKGWISFQAGVRTSLTLMPTAEAAFMDELPELMDGAAHTDMELPIFVEAGLRWTVDGAGSDWLSIADKVGGTYGQKLTGTSTTGGWENIYVKVSANTSQTTPRTGDLTLRAWRADNSEVPAAVLRLVQNYYTFAPVGGVWNTSFAAASDPVQPFASNQQWTAESDAAWLLLATSPTVGLGNPSQKYVKAGALGANELYIQVTENTSATARRGVVTITSPLAGAAPMKIYVNQMGNQPYVEIGGLRWATGNLVATRSSVEGVSAPGCMIGAPEDGGLYFQFGSLIGYKGGAADYQGTGNKTPDASISGKAWNGAAAWSWNNDAMVWPSNMVGNPTTWPTNTTNQWYFGLQTGWSTAGQNIRDFLGFVAGNLASAGVGDPCTYYLGAEWRLPTSTEYGILFDNVANNTNWASVPNWSWTTTPNNGAVHANNGLYIVASGWRNGLFRTITQGYAWSSNVGTALNGVHTTVYDKGVYPQSGNVRINGCPVRCTSLAMAVNKDRYWAGLAGGTTSVQLTTLPATNWSITTAGAGLSVSKRAGVGNDVFSITYAPLAAGSRIGTVTITNGASSINITCNQSQYPSIGYVTKGVGEDGLNLPIGLMHVGLFGGHNGAAYTRGLYMDKRGTNINGINQGIVNDGTMVWDYFGTTTGITNTFTGLANTNALTASSAANYCRNKGAGWYLPARRQLKDGMYAVKASGLLTQEYTFIEDSYWSSTEQHLNATWYVNPRDGGENVYNKNYNLHVRCVREL